MSMFRVIMRDRFYIPQVKGIFFWKDFSGEDTGPAPAFKTLEEAMAFLKFYREKTQCKNGSIKT